MTQKVIEKFEHIVPIGYFVYVFYVDRVRSQSDICSDRLDDRSEKVLIHFVIEKSLPKFFRFFLFSKL